MTPPFSCRRAELRDVARIQRLIKGGDFGRDDMERTLQRRFGDDYNIAEIIDMLPLCIVAATPDDTSILGFAAMALSLPRFVASKASTHDDSNDNKKPGSQLVSGKWDEWIQKSYDLKQVNVYNCAFFSFFYADPDISVVFLDSVINITYELLPEVKHICYFLPDSLILFPPFSSPHYRPPVTTETPVAAADDTVKSSTQGGSVGGANALMNGRANRRRMRNLRRNDKYFTEVPLLNPSLVFSLQICQRKDIMPMIRVRKARVEDCDDLVPMFRRQNLLKGDHADYYLANLVESKSETVRTLVAETDGEVVGFMSISRDIDQTLLHDQYHLEMFDYLVKDLKPVPDLESRSKKSMGSISMEKGAGDQDKSTNTDTDNIVTRTQSLLIDPAFDEEDAKTPTAFCINMFCIENAYASYSGEFVRAAFSVFQGRDYCLMTLPPNTPEMKLLQGFSRVRALRGKIAPHDLYIANRFGVGEAVRVRRGVEADLDRIEALTFGLSHQEDVMNAASDALLESETSRIVLYVAEQGSQLAGVVMLSHTSDPDMFVDQYELEQFVSVKISPLTMSPIVLRYAIFNPLFEVQTRRVFSEVLRQSQCPCIVYLVDEAAQRDPATQRIAIQEMVPVRPRRVIEYPDNMRDGKPVAKQLPYNLQLITTSLIFEPRIVVNSRIVVLGGSDAGTAFLETLVYTPHLHFTQLTVVCKARPESTTTRPSYFVNNRCYTPLERRKLALEYYVEYVYDTADHLDRDSKLIRLGSGRLLAYDYLVLCPGLQYHACQLDPGFATLHGVYSVVRHDEETLLTGIQSFKTSSDDATAVVFGRSLQAYATVEMLLREGVAPTKIVMVDPIMPSNPSCLDDPMIEERVFGYMTSIGIKHYRGYRILKWGVLPDSSPQALFGIVIVNRETDEPVRLPTTERVFYADELSIDVGTFKLINDSWLVFDGRLVIDKYFRTQDPFIFAVGSLTKYASRYQTKWSHAAYDSRELGTKLADTLLTVFDPTLPPTILDDTDELLTFTESKKIEAVLPGGQYYLCFDCPRLRGPVAAERLNKQIYGRDLIIDRILYGYFKIHLDPLGYIVSVTYIGKEKIPTGNILCLYGMHESYLNRLVARFDEGVIYDFIKFFNEQWALPLFHDRFRIFAKKAYEQGCVSESDEMREIMDHLNTKVTKNDMVLMERERGLLYRMFDQSPDRRQWDAKVFEFLLDSRVFRSFP